LVDLLGLDPHVGERQVVAGLRNNFADVFHQPRGIRRDAQFEMRAAAYKRQTYDGRGGFAQLGVLCVAHDADDGIATSGIWNVIAVGVAVSQMLPVLGLRKQS
jgi:hypothetical protein